VSNTKKNLIAQAPNENFEIRPEELFKRLLASGDFAKRIKIGEVYARFTAHHEEPYPPVLIGRWGFKNHDKRWWMSFRYIDGQWKFYKCLNFIPERIEDGS
jgi:hypothetical protein